MLLRQLLTASVTMLLLLTGLSTGWAQLSRGGSPLTLTKAIPGDMPTRVMPSIDVEALLVEDSVEEAQGLPFRFGRPFDVHWDINDVGAWTELDDGGRVWRLRIICPGAYSINLLYDTYYAPEGAELFVFSEGGEMVRGAFTHRNNKEHGQFATAPVMGDTTIIEYYEPAAARGRSELVISRVVHGYKDIFEWSDKDGDGFGGSGFCNNNVNCPEGDPWQVEKRAVAMVLTSSGTRWCTGSLVNNVRQDETPLFLTANHCLGGESSWVFMFNYESPSCANIDGPTNFTLQGSTKLANWSTSDFALLLLNEPPPDSYYVYYAGWSAVNSPSTQSTAIHHPSGDIKKISFDYNPVTSTNYLSTTGNTHWRVGNWEDGTTEGGSSGSPLFDQNHRVVGQLHGGYASCYSITADWYGKFSLSWDGGGSPATRLRDWLDPDNGGTLMIDGYDPFAGVEIVHTPLPDTRDTSGSYTVTCAITHFYELMPDSARLFWRTDGAWTSQVLSPVGANDEYFTSIPAQPPGTEVSYYLYARDFGGFIDSTETFEFRVIDYAVDLAPAFAVDSAAIDDTVWYDLTVTNAGIYTDEFDLAISDDDWSSQIWDVSRTVPLSSTGPLVKDESLDLAVSVAIPEAAYGAQDTITIAAVSIGDPIRESSSLLITGCRGSTGSFPWVETLAADSLNPIRWIYSVGAEVNGSPLNPPSPPWVLHLDGGNDTLVSQIIDMRGQAGSVLSYFLQMGGNGSLPAADESLFVDFRASLGQWVNITSHAGGGSPMTQFDLFHVRLPNHAIHDEFQLRLRSSGDSEGEDDWFIDDIRIDRAPAVAVWPDSIDIELMPGESTTVDLQIDNSGTGMLVYVTDAQPLAGELFAQLQLQDRVEPAGNENAYRYPLYLNALKGAESVDGGRTPLFNAGGPDDFGNYWIDSDEPGGPMFDWVDVSTSGEDIVGLLDDDNVVGPLALGFDFPFYGTDYSEVYIGSNGIIGFSAPDMGSRVGTPLPTPDTPNNLVAWLWKDLDVTDDDNTDAHVFFDTTGPNLVIQFVDYPEYNGAPGDVVTAQLILEPSGLIKIQYLSIGPGFDPASATVGIENYDGTDGLEVVYAAPYVHDSLAIWIYQPQQWLSVDHRIGQVEAASDGLLQLTIDAADLDTGQYLGQIVVDGNDPDTLSNPSVIPVVLIVDDTPPYICGDANGDASGPDIADLVFLTAYMFNGGPAPPIPEAVNVDGNETAGDIADLVYLVSFMFQSGPPPQCP